MTPGDAEHAATPPGDEASPATPLGDEVTPAMPRARRRSRSRRGESTRPATLTPTFTAADPALVNRPAPPRPAEPGEPTTTGPSTDPSTDRPLVALLAPADGVPDVVEDERALAAAAEALAGGTGPLAIDAERASGYRYGQRAYLVQLRRRGSGTWLIDPIGCPDLTPLAAALDGVEWVLHAATQDLPCLAELGLRPQRLFDTELGARLAGRPKVGLGFAVEHYLGLSLAKEHSAADWSTRPLPAAWLTYAALDVEILLELRDAIEADLAEQGKLGWAEEEFAALTSFTGPPVKPDRWRRVSGINRIRDRRRAGVLRELWLARDDIARERDISSGRVIPDSALVELAVAVPASLEDMAAASSNRAVRRYQKALHTAIRRAATLPDAELPPLRLPSDGPPPPRAWADRDPLAAARLTAVRNGLGALSDAHHVPTENILSPDTVRRMLWTPPASNDDEVRRTLADRGARQWQIDLAAPLILDALLHASPATEPDPEPDTEPDAGPHAGTGAEPAAGPDAEPDARRP